MKTLIVVKKHSDNFIRHYYRYMPDTDVYGGAHYQLNNIPVKPGVAAKKSKEYDVVIFEWGNDLTAQTLRHPEYPHGKVTTIVRVHDHEIKKRADGKRRIDFIPWNKVDAAWFINKQVKADFFALLPGVQSFFLPNCVDPQPFKQNKVSEKRIGLLTIYARKRKRLDRAILLMKDLPDWELTIRCADYSPETDGGPEHLKSLKELAAGMPNVKWEWRHDDFTRSGYPHGDVADFWKDKAITLSTSAREGFGYNIAEGAMAGCMPVVWEWDYGRAFDFWEPFVVSNYNEAIKKVKSYHPSDEWRKYVMERFSPGVLVPALMKKIESIAG